jgi:nicotinamide mononucleotide transporter
MTDFLHSDLFIEILGAITGFIYLNFSIKQNIWLWPWGIITSLLYVYIFYREKDYAYMCLQLYYFVISIYGWYYWSDADKRQSGLPKPVIRAGRKELTVFIVMIGILTAATGSGLDKFTDSPLPYWESFTVSGSIIATWMLARKYIEQWLFWIVIDIVSVGMFVYQGLYPTVILFTVYTLMAVIGYYQWNRELIKERAI